MKLIKSIALGSLLLGVIGSAYAEDGSTRPQAFKENFLAEQSRLWSGDSAAKEPQHLALQQERRDFKDGSSHQATTTKDFR
ncbi:hypothetical protein D3C79_379710 [compost metagenome]